MGARAHRLTLDDGVDDDDDDADQDDNNTHGRHDGRYSIAPDCPRTTRHTTVPVLRAGRCATTYIGWPSAVANGFWRGSV